ncbi:MAG TPA: response regulator [Chitinophagaceae bacterium]|nr:response regulator [Chitinophagaceae bacterium]
MPDLRFLLIDDNEIDLFFHDKLLRYQGISINIVPFNNAQQALEFLSSDLDQAEIPETMILLDIQMPEMDGFDFLKHFEKYPSRIKSKCHIIMVSSSLDFGDISRANANALIIRLLKKPLNTKELKEIISTIFG